MLLFSLWVVFARIQMKKKCVRAKTVLWVGRGVLFCHEVAWQWAWWGGVVWGEVGPASR